MLINIRSSYILIKIISNISERQKLKLVKYNKKIQYKIDINLLNYKLFSGKYIVY